MKKIFILIPIIVFWGCEENPVTAGAVPQLEGTKWQGVDNMDNSILWQFDFWDLNGNNMWRFRDFCDSSCGGTSYTLNTSANPAEIDLLINMGCMDEEYMGSTAKGIYKIDTDTLNGVISYSTLTIAISEPGDDSRPSSFSEGRVWILDYVDLHAAFYEDTFLADGSSQCQTGTYDPTGYTFSSDSTRTYLSNLDYHNSNYVCSGESEIVYDPRAYWYRFTADSVFTNNTWSTSGGEYVWVISDIEVGSETFSEVELSYYNMIDVETKAECEADPWGTWSSSESLCYGWEYPGPKFIFTSNTTAYRQFPAICSDGYGGKDKEECEETSILVGGDVFYTWKPCEDYLYVGTLSD